MYKTLERCEYSVHWRILYCPHKMQIFLKSVNKAMLGPFGREYMKTIILLFSISWDQQLLKQSLKICLCSVLEAASVINMNSYLIT